MMKKQRCPDVVKIGFQQYRIVQLSTQEDPLLADSSHGYTQDSRNIIVIDRDLPETKKRVTVFHELFHACRFIFKNDPTPKKMDYEEWEHHFINLWQDSMLMVLKDNPELTQWLLEKN